MIKILRSKLMTNGGYSVIVSPVTKLTYVVPMWIEVPMGTTINDIQVIDDSNKAQIPVKSERIERIVKGSKGNVYSVILDYQNGHSCSCPGFAYHKRQCKHINELTIKKL